ncbi:hypothetical protein [Aureimonas sp. AU12]|uniref:FitA-like ribbon-helix-helix domain-containing protein n=1 Tax=Aureimonas sp. AU12 TaxID=1638161 RepID=UPI000705DAF3|nr:hypothetical protein [Aureimonas sp. AU12]BAT29778.1 plasmid stability protein [Aureimonas sp. AU12]
MDDLTFEIDDNVLEILRVRAIAHGRTLEDEARHLILRSLDDDREIQSGVSETATAAFAQLRAKAGGGADMDLPMRSHEPMRPIDLDA